MENVFVRSAPKASEWFKAFIELPYQRWLNETVMVFPDCPTCRALSAKAYEALTSHLRLQDRVDIAQMSGAEPPSALALRRAWWAREVAMDRYRAHCLAHDLNHGSAMPEDVITASPAARSRLAASYVAANAPTARVV